MLYYVPTLQCNVPRTILQETIGHKEALRLGGVGQIFSIWRLRKPSLRGKYEGIYLRLKICAGITQQTLLQ